MMMHFVSPGSKKTPGPVIRLIRWSYDKGFLGIKNTKEDDNEESYRETSISGYMRIILAVFRVPL